MQLKDFIKNRKGIGLRDLVPVALLIVVGGIALGMGAKVLSKIQGTLTSGTTAYAAVGNATESIGELASWYPTIAIVIAAAIIIGVLVVAFKFR